MQRITVHNTTGMPIYVGSTMIPAGDSRDFDERDVPAHLRPAPAIAAEVEAPAEPPPADPLAELIKKPVREIVEAFGTLTAEQLAELDAREHTDPTPRKTLLEAIGEERLRRAQGNGDQA